MSVSSVLASEGLHAGPHRMSMSSVLPSLLTASSAAAGLMLPA